MKDWNVIEQVKDASTPEEMRAEIFRLQYHDPIVKAVMDMANYSGMNAEDRYTILAYHALKAKNDAQSRILEFARISPSPAFIVKETQS